MGSNGEDGLRHHYIGNITKCMSGCLEEITRDSRDPRDGEDWCNVLHRERRRRRIALSSWSFQAAFSVIVFFRLASVFLRVNSEAFCILVLITII